MVADRVLGCGRLLSQREIVLRCWPLDFGFPPRQVESRFLVLRCVGRFWLSFDLLTGSRDGAARQSVDFDVTAGLVRVRLRKRRTARITLQRSG